MVVRAFTALGTRKAETPEDRALLYGMLDDPSPAIWAVVAATDTDPRVRCAVPTAPGLLVEDSGVILLSALHQDANWLLREAVAQAPGLMQPSNARDMAEMLVLDPRPMVRAATATPLGAASFVGADSTLAAVRADRTPSMREAAEAAVAQRPRWTEADLPAIGAVPNRALTAAATPAARAVGVVVR